MESRSHDFAMRLFWAWISLRVVVWSTASAYRYQNPPVDVAEMLAWGARWQWGYYKHPPLPAWCAEALAWAFHGWLPALYLTSHLFLTVAVWTAWRIGRELLGEKKALLAALSLEATCFFTWFGGELNHNTALTCFWALAIWSLWKAVSSGQWSWWVVYGAVTGLGLLSKYNMGLLVAWQAVALVLFLEGRRTLTTPKPWVAWGIALALFSPHLIWLIDQDWITLRYLAGRGGNRNGWFAHARGIVGFLAEQSWMAWGLLLPLLPVLSGRKRDISGNKELERHLCVVVLGPMVTILMMVLAGKRVIGFWCFPCYTFAGVVLLARWGAKDDGLRFRASVGLSAAIALGLLALTLWGDPFLVSRGSSTVRSRFPGKALAEAAESAWFEQTGNTRIPIVAGEHWVADNLSLFSRGRPTVYVGESPQSPLPVPRYNPWTGDMDFKHQGGVFAWETAKSPVEVERDLRSRFPGIRLVPRFELPLIGSSSTIGFGLAVLPPAVNEP